MAIHEITVRDTRCYLHSGASRQKQSTKQQQMLSRKCAKPITFGIEIESVLAFHEKELQSVIDHYYDGEPVIVKSFPDNAHTDCFLNEDVLSHQCRNLYPSWALQVPIESELDQSLQVVGQKSTSIIGRPGKLRSYLAEPLIMARDAIGSIGTPVDIKAQIRRYGDDTWLPNSDTANGILLRSRSADYRNWTLTTDHTLIGCLESQLIDAIGEGAFQRQTSIDLLSTARARKWDSSGLEIISPVFKYSEKKDAFKAVTECLTRISRSPTLKLLPSTWASLQVHIGLDYQTSEKTLLSTIQHLAFFLICNENLLSSMHPRSRCGVPLKRAAVEATVVDDEVNYNDEEEVEDEDAPQQIELTPAELAAQDEEYKNENDKRVLEVESAYTGFNTTNSNARYFCQMTAVAYPPTVEHVAITIFDPSITLPQLISLLQKPSTNSRDAAKGHRFRGYMYNFDNILTTYLEDSDAWKIGKPTIEFRQHACSTDAEEIRRWVELCYAITNFAYGMAQSEATITNEGECSEWMKEAGKYGIIPQWPFLDIEQVLGSGGLDIDANDIGYWIERYARYKGERPSRDEIDDTF